MQVDMLQRELATYRDASLQLDNVIRNMFQTRAVENQNHVSQILQQQAMLHQQQVEAYQAKAELSMRESVIFAGTQMLETIVQERDALYAKLNHFAMLSCHLYREVKRMGMNNAIGQMQLEQMKIKINTQVMAAKGFRDSWVGFCNSMLDVKQKQLLQGQSQALENYLSICSAPMDDNVHPVVPGRSLIQLGYQPLMIEGQRVEPQDVLESSGDIPVEGISLAGKHMVGGMEVVPCGYNFESALIMQGR